MTIVTPEQWYRLFWVAMGVGFLAAQYFVIKWAVLAAYMQIMALRGGS